jgi:hypothetical protein
MDLTERLANDHLIHRGHATPQFEPLGNVPPDFLLDGRIAVEVRRLNQNEIAAPGPKGLEEVEIPLLMGMQRLLKSYGPPVAGAWRVGLSFRRPIPPFHVIAQAVKQFLSQVQSGTVPTGVRQQIAPNIEMDASPASGTWDEMFHLAVTSDHDSGGWVLEELERNINICIASKTAKIASYRHRYPEWWLLLVDHIAYGLSEFDLGQFRSSVTITHSWDKVIIVNPHDCTHYFDL